MQNAQQGILDGIPDHALYLFFSLKPETNPVASLQLLGDLVNGDSIVAGLGKSLLSALGKDVAFNQLRDFPPYSGPGFDVPSTPSALWLWLRGKDRGELLLESLKIQQLLSEGFNLDKQIDAFMYRDSRDLTGYEDGTENPQGQEAINASLVQNQGPGLDGSSFVAIQQWLHNLQHFQDMPQHEQDNTIGRQISDNEEIDSAPESAHVKRTAQEDFEPEAFILRRSMPWSKNSQAGLVFVAFGHSLDAYEAILKRMVGKDDGIVDALFKFSHPITGGFFWCPPIKDSKLDLSILSL